MIKYRTIPRKSKLRLVARLDSLQRMKTQSYTRLKTVFWRVLCPEEEELFPPYKQFLFQLSYSLQARDNSELLYMLCSDSSAHGTSHKELEKEILQVSRILSLFCNILEFYKHLCGNILVTIQVSYNILKLNRPSDY